MKRLYGIIGCFLIWYLLSSLFHSIIPHPHDVIYQFFNLYPTIHPHLLASLKRILLGLFIAIVLGVHIGLIIGLSKKSETLLLPIIYGLYPIPKAALLPIMIILFGIGDLTKILLIIFIVIFPIIINIKDAIKAIPDEVFYIAKSLSLNFIQMYTQVIIPAILPSLLTTIRLGIGISVAVLYLSENFATQYGLGYFITLHMSNSLKMFIGIFGLSLIGYVLFSLVDLLERKLCKWV